MNNFKPGGQRNRKEFLGGRPRSDADYGTKKRFDSKPRFESRGRDENRSPARFNDRAPKEVQLFNATCTTCGKSCEVPFRPDGTKPVLCRDCFAAKNTSPAGGGERDNRFVPHTNERSNERVKPHNPPVVQNTDITALTRQFAVLEAKLNEVLALLQTKSIKPTADSSAKSEEVKETVPAVTKKAVAKKAVKKAAVKKVAAKKVAKPVAKKASKK
jgi:CxxC-x17-CxxC domain-containing protein